MIVVLVLLLSHVRLCDAMDCSTPDFPVLSVSRSLVKLISIELVMQSNHLILCHPLLLLPSIFPASGSFPMSQPFTSSGHSVGASASATVLPMNIQGWFPLVLTISFSLQSKGLSRVSSNTTLWKHQFFDTQPSLWSNKPKPKARGEEKGFLCYGGIS